MRNKKQRLEAVRGCTAVLSDECVFPSYPPSDEILSVAVLRAGSPHPKFRVQKLEAIDSLLPNRLNELWAEYGKLVPVLISALSVAVGAGL